MDNVQIVIFDTKFEKVVSDENEALSPERSEDDNSPSSEITFARVSNIIFRYRMRKENLCATVKLSKMRKATLYAFCIEIIFLPTRYRNRSSLLRFNNCSFVRKGWGSFEESEAGRTIFSFTVFVFSAVKY